MSLGGMIPVNTYVCPVLCTVLGCTVLRICGKRIAWAWYGAVSLLGLLLGPDKEAAAVYLFLGYYPILKPWFDRLRLGVLWKLLYFNAVVAALYGALIWLMGMAQLVTEFTEPGLIGLAVTLVLGNAAFLMLDHLLTRLMRKR